MTDHRNQLLARESDLVQALQVLEQDHRDGLIDDDAFEAFCRELEAEWAELPARADALPDGTDAAPAPERGRAVPTRRTGIGRRRRAFIISAGVAVCIAAACVFLIGAVQARPPGGVITGSVGRDGTSTAPQPTVDLGAAQRAVYQHPRSYAALVTLGTAYLQSGRIMEADLSFQAAMRQDPGRPDAPTLHAMLLGAIKQYRQALVLLSRVEREHPAYARAWLMDGILSSHVPGDRQRAVGAWLRFLLLAPQSDLAPTVRQWISQSKQQRP